MQQSLPSDEVGCHQRQHLLHVEIEISGSLSPMDFSFRKEEVWETKMHHRLLSAVSPPGGGATVVLSQCTVPADL